MPSRQSVKLSKDSLILLSTASIRNDVLVSELADAIISGTDWKINIESLLERIREGRKTNGKKTLSTVKEGVKAKSV